MQDLWPQLALIAEIIGVNIVLSGDNAVVIALACRGLPPRQRRIGMMLGAGVAVVLRVVFTVVVVSLLAIPYLRLAGAALLIWVAVKLVVGEDEGDEIAATDKLWHAVRTVAIADAVMSLDNVLAIAAVAKDNNALLALGLAISIPLIVVGANFVMLLLDRFPILVWAGAGLLGWVAGDMAASDPVLTASFGADRMHALGYPASALGAALVLGLGWVMKQRRGAAREIPERRA